jgi:hypothetical protein
MVAVAVVALAAGIWFLRAPLAGAVLRAVLADYGVRASFQLIQFDFSSATLNNLVVGDAARPDFKAPLAEAHWRWRGLQPELQSVRILRPELRLNIDRTGRLSAGALNDFRARSGSGRRPSIPRIRLDIEDGAALIDAPFGQLRADFEAGGVIGRDFSALARIAETSRPGADYALEAGAAELSVRSRGDRLRLHLTAGADALTWSSAQIAEPHLDFNAEAPLDLGTVAGEAAWQALTIRSPDIDADGLAGALGGRAAISESSFSTAGWSLEGRVNLGHGRWQTRTLRTGQLNARLEGNAARGSGAWSLNAAHFDGFSLRSASPSASGQISFDGPGAIQAETQIALGATTLDADAQDQIRRAIPNAGGSPIGPTLAQLESALDRGADRFDLTVPLSLVTRDGATRLTITQPIEARAATGAIVRASPLREDTPSLAMQWPGGALHGAAALDLDGGGLAAASILLDSIDWSPNAPFEAEGTLAIRQWRAGEARIAADEIGLALIVQPDGRGRVDLTGPLNVTGPVGDGQVRDMITDLDLAIQFGAGWRVTPNRGCLPVRLAALDAVGLSFQGGAFGLCAGPSGALAATDANGRWSEGFVIENLALSGRMSGPEAQPARLSATRVVGRFSGGGDDIHLAIEASAPSLSVEMSAERTIAVLGQSLTADTRFGNGAWRTDGAFNLGRLDDPGLPGEITAIQGKWSAAPEDNRVVVRVAAAEAALTARAAGPEDERPLFNPMRLIDIDATMADGEINADGALVLSERTRDLAQFTAQHRISEGVGGARFVAEAISFGPDLQPYEITELARGVVENVRGPAAGIANIVWDDDGVRASGSVTLNGVSLAMATIPVIENVRGEIVFDDLLKLTTPPGQAVTVGVVNPGIAVSNGRVRFQLLGDLRVAVEQAEFDFASGILALDPTTIVLGADEARVRLLLRDVDAATLLAQLNIPDLNATGTIEGSFPLLLARNTAYVENGELYAAPGGGVIQYVGNAGEGATGMSRVAFDALRNFSYEDLRITLNGDISGEVVSAIHFTGENTGRPVDITEIANIPGVGQVTARGVPFVFNVNVTAPFRRLAQTAAGFTNPGDIIGGAINSPPPEDEDQ